MLNGLPFIKTSFEEHNHQWKKFSEDVWTEVRHDFEGSRSKPRVIYQVMQPNANGWTTRKSFSCPWKGYQGFSLYPVEPDSVPSKTKGGQLDP